MLFNNYLNIILLKKKINYIFLKNMIILLNIRKYNFLNIKNFKKYYILNFFISLNSFNLIYIYKFLLKLFFFFNFKTIKSIIYLPKKIIKYTLIKSPFVFKKGRDQFELIFEKIKIIFSLNYFYNNFFLNYLFFNLQLNYILITIKKKL